MGKRVRSGVNSRFFPSPHLFNQLIATFDAIQISFNSWKFEQVGVESFRVQTPLFFH